MIDILERFLRQINLHRSPINRITYNVVSSTMPSQYIRSMEGKSADCDSMNLISLFYGKQVVVSEARGREESASADGIAGSAFDDEVMLYDVEQLKHLLPYDLGLAEKDCAYHSPLYGRIRSKDSEDKRRARWGELTKATRKSAMTTGRSARSARIVRRLCGVIPLRILTTVDPDQPAEYLGLSAVYRAETFLLAGRIRRHRCPKTPRVKAAPAFLRQATSTSNVVPPVKAPSVPPPRPARSPSAARPVATRTVGTSSKTPP